MSKFRSAAKWFAGLAVLSSLALGAVTAPAQALDTGWNPTSIHRGNTK